MLTYDQIITLSDKGFSPEQIVKLTGEEIPEQKPEPEQKQEPEQKPEPEKKLEPEKEPEKKPEPEKDSISSILQDAIKGFSSEVAEMRKALQASNIRNVVQDDIPPSKSAAEDMLAEIIRPTFKERS